MKVAIYARTSTGEQDIGLQLETLKEYCKGRGFEIYNIYQDEGISGSKDKRPGLDKLMQDAKRRKFNIVLVWKFDRFARSTRHLIESLEIFNSLGIDFISYTEGIDTSIPIGKMVFTIIGAIAEFERDLIRERVRAGVARAREKGKKLGRPKVEYDYEKLVSLRKKGLSFFEIGRECGISKSKVWQLLRS